MLDGWIDYADGLRVEWVDGLPARASHRTSATAAIDGVLTQLGLVVVPKECGVVDGAITCTLAVEAKVLTGFVFAMQRDLGRFEEAPVEPELTDPPKVTADALAEDAEPAPEPELTPEAKGAALAIAKEAATAKATEVAAKVSAAAAEAAPDDAAALAASDLTLLTPEIDGVILALDADGVMLPVPGWHAMGTDAISVGWHAERDGVRYLCTASAGPPAAVTAHVTLLAQTI